MKVRVEKCEVLVKEVAETNWLVIESWTYLNSALPYFTQTGTTYDENT